MSEPYQSRVFTFLSNRTNQLKNNCVKGLRHLKVVVVWSGQILLYPLQLLAQTKIFQPQVSTPPPPPVLPQPVPDINIEQALDLVEVAGYPIQIAKQEALSVDDWSFIDENLWNTGHGNTSIKSQEIAYSPRKSSQITPPKPTIRGLSSLLSDRQLVLVTAENELLNILTIAEQQSIRRRIGIDLATTWDRWYLNKLPGDRPQQELSSNQKLLLTGENITDRDRELRSPNLLERLRNWFRNSVGEPPQQPVINEIAPNSQPQLAPATYPFTPQPPKFDRYLELPQLPPITDDLSSPEPEPKIKLAIANIATRIQPDWLKKWWNYCREYVYISADLDPADLTTDGAIVHAPEEFKLTPIEPTPSQIKVKQVKSQQLQIEQTSNINIAAKSVDGASLFSLGRGSANAERLPQQKENRQLEYQQDWIETEAETIGYSQSFVAKLLAWLDRVMFRLENCLMSIISYPISIVRKWF